MRFLRSLTVIVVVIGVFVFLGHGWRSASIREGVLKEQLTTEHLMRIADSALHNLRQQATPNNEAIVDLEEIVWEMCFGGGDIGVAVTPFSTAHIKCSFMPKLGTYEELIQDFPLYDYSKLKEHLNTLLVNRQIDVTVLGFEDPEMVFPTPDGRGRDLKRTKFFDPVVIVKFQIQTWPIIDLPGEPITEAAWLKFTEPTYEFP